MSLHPKAFANSLALVSALCYLLFYALGTVSPAVLVFVYNAQFMGANMAKYIPTAVPFWFFLGNFLTVVILSWLLAYIWAWLYNKLAK